MHCFGVMDDLLFVLWTYRKISLETSLKKTVQEIIWRRGKGSIASRRWSSEPKAESWNFRRPAEG